MAITILKNTLTVLLAVGLAFSSAFLGFLLYFKLPAKDALSEPLSGKTSSSTPPTPTPTQDFTNGQSLVTSGSQTKKSANMIEAPIVLQNPELPSGCELVALTMLLQFYGINKSKMELLPEMKIDPTPIQWNSDGTIKYWGNPNLGYVGDITGKQKGFGIYHAALFELLQKYIPTAVDLTTKPFEQLEQQISEGIPVVVWTTIPFRVPTEKQWVVWDSPLGPIRTTFIEHAVLLVGYDEKHVYVNDPLSGKKNYKIEKERFVSTWEALGRQALSYQKPVK